MQRSQGKGRVKTGRRKSLGNPGHLLFQKAVTGAGRDPVSSPGSWGGVGCPPVSKQGPSCPARPPWSCEPRKRIHPAGEVCAQTPKATVPTPSGGRPGDLGHSRGSVQRCSHVPEHPGFPPAQQLWEVTPTARTGREEVVGRPRFCVPMTGHPCGQG